MTCKLRHLPRFRFGRAEGGTPAAVAELWTHPPNILSRAYYKSNFRLLQHLLRAGGDARIHAEIDSETSHPVPTPRAEAWNMRRILLASVVLACFIGFMNTAAADYLIIK